VAVSVIISAFTDVCHNNKNKVSAQINQVEKHCRAVDRNMSPRRTSRIHRYFNERKIAYRIYM